MCVCVCVCVCVHEAPEPPLTYQIPDEGDRDGPRRVGYIYTHLTQLIAREDFIEFSHRESSMSDIILIRSY